VVRLLWGEVAEGEGAVGQGCCVVRVLWGEGAVG
jgi:hypothetical protein